MPVPVRVEDGLYRVPLITTGRPMAQSDGHDAPGLIDELVPRHTAVVDEIVVRFEDAVRQPQGDLLWADLNCSEVEVLQAPLYARGTSDMRIKKQRAHPA